MPPVITMSEQTQDNGSQLNGNGHLRWNFISMILLDDSATATATATGAAHCSSQPRSTRERPFWRSASMFFLLNTSLRLTMRMMSDSSTVTNP